MIWVIFGVWLRIDMLIKGDGGVKEDDMYEVSGYVGIRFGGKMGIVGGGIGVCDL